MWGSDYRGGSWAAAVVLFIVFAFAACPQAHGAFPDIRINNDTGSNPPAASGAPANFGPVIPPNACATSGASTTIQSVGHGLGLVPTDGSAVLWMETGSGRRWTRILGVPNADTITVESSFNIAVAVACAVGGTIAGTLANVQNLCADVRFGWTLTLEFTGTDYTDSGACNILATGSLGATAEIPFVRGDDPDNRTVILWGSNADYLTSTGVTGNGGLKFENLELVKNAAGTTGEAITLKNNTILKNVVIRNAVGSWAFPVASGAKMVMINSRFVGPFTNCLSAGSADFIVGNFFDTCGGTTALRGLVAFNIFDVGGVAADALAVSEMTHWLHNTIVGGARAAIDITTVAGRPSLVGSNLAVDNATASGDCLEASFTGAASLLGENGRNPNILWLGNNAFACPGGLYDATLAATPQGAAGDLAAGAGLDPDFQDAASLDFFPLNTALVDPAAFPGSTYPFLTPALPQSIPTAGAAQRSAGGAGAYAF